MLLIPLATLLWLMPAQAPAGTPIVLDAVFEDWAAIEPVAVDPLGDAPGAFIDFGEVRAAVDDHFVHLLVDFGHTVNVQGLDGTVMIIINADSNDSTGEAMHEVMGVDIIIDLTPPNARQPGAPGRGIGLRSTTYTPDPSNPNLPPLNPYDIRFAFAPTHAGRRMEFAIGRGVFPNLPPLFTGRSFTAQLVYSDLAGVIRDETPAFTCALPPIAAGATTAPDDAGQPTDPLARAPGAAARIVSWNAEVGAIIADPEPFLRTLSALKPEVLLLQELRDRNTIDELSAFTARLNQAIGKDERGWTVILGQGGGDLRCAVLSRLPAAPAAELNNLPYLNRPDRTIRSAGAVIEIGGRRLLAVSAHLKCCGRLGSPEDATRIEEVTAIRQAIDQARAVANFDGLLIAGDFNLVGGRDPLEHMLVGIDFDRSSLNVIDAYQIDGRSNATWADRDQPFVPGRLDYAVVSDSTMQALRAFVYDARDLSPRWREHHRTQADDTDQASDHLPIVIDIAWR